MRMPLSATVIFLGLAICGSQLNADIVTNTLTITNAFTGASAGDQVTMNIEYSPNNPQAGVSENSFWFTISSMPGMQFTPMSSWDNSSPAIGTAANDGNNVVMGDNTTSFSIIGNNFSGSIDINLDWSCGGPGCPFPGNPDAEILDIFVDGQFEKIGTGETTSFSFNNVASAVPEPSSTVVMMITALLFSIRRSSRDRMVA